MGDFCKPWRRKFGVVTLVLACLFFGGLLRSHNLSDQMRFMLFGYGYHFRSEFGRMEVGLYWSSDGADISKYFNSSWSWWAQRLPDIDQWKPHTVCGFSFNKGEHVLMRATEIGGTLPYWSIVIPFTALSAWLLLTNPRPSTSKKIAEPTANKGT